MEMDFVDERMPPIKNHNKRLFLIDIRTDTLKTYPYRTTRLKRLVPLEKFGMDETFFGGNIFTIAEVRDKPLYLLCNRDLETLGVCVRTDELEKLTKTELIEWAQVQRIKIKKEDTKEIVIDKLTSLA